MLWLLAAGAVGFNLLATYVLVEPGAGSSGATFFVAASVTGGLRRGRPPVTGVAVLLTLLGGAALVIAHDAHGVAVLAGLLAGIALPAPATVGTRLDHV